MTAAELIAELSRYPAHMPVMVIVEWSGEWHPELSSPEDCGYDTVPVSAVIHEGGFLSLDTE